jgi:hypothetical protein
MLPFPSPLRAPAKCFRTSIENGVTYFRYMGRSKFSQFKECIEEDHKRAKVHLSGCPGSGKSHILAALAVRLYQEGKRVVYISDCFDLVIDFKHTMKMALCCAFYDDPDALQAILSAQYLDDLIQVWRSLGRPYLIVDHLNKLIHEPGDRHSEAKDSAFTWLLRMGFRRNYIYAAVEDEWYAQDNRVTRGNVTTFPLYGGMDEVCSIWVIASYVIDSFCRRRQNNGLSIILATSRY